MTQSNALVQSHFLDSGAFSLWTAAAKYAKENNCDVWKFYDTKQFYSYMDAYAAFIKKYKVAIDLYANLDVIPNPELTWRNQLYLEKKGLTPVPVIHYKTSTKWVEHYIRHGYKIIGLGGLVGSTIESSCIRWLDKCFSIICDTKDRLPKVKVHGFGVSGHELLTHYPWWSVDSTNWFRLGSFGTLLIPTKTRTQEYDYMAKPQKISVSTDSPKYKTGKGHWVTLSLAEQIVLQEWLDFIKIPLGTADGNDNIIEPGVTNHYSYRTKANLLYYQKLCENLPKWPHPFKKKYVKGFF